MTEIIELKKQGLSAPKIAKKLNLSLYEVMKTFDYDRFLKSHRGKGGAGYPKGTTRLTDAARKKEEAQADHKICKDWIQSNYELSLCFETPALEIYKSYEYYIINVYNLKNDTNLNPVSAAKFRKIMTTCGFDVKKKHYMEAGNFYFNCERK